MIPNYCRTITSAVKAICRLVSPVSSTLAVTMISESLHIAGPGYFRTKVLTIVIGLLLIFIFSLSLTKSKCHLAVVTCHGRPGASPFVWTTHLVNIKFWTMEKKICPRGLPKKLLDTSKCLLTKNFETFCSCPLHYRSNRPRYKASSRKYRMALRTFSHYQQ